MYCIMVVRHPLGELQALGSLFYLSFAGLRFQNKSQIPFFLKIYCRLIANDRLLEISTKYFADNILPSFVRQVDGNLNINHSSSIVI